MTRKTEFIIILLWPIVASILSLNLHANFFLSLVLFLAVPAVFLSILRKKLIKKLILATLTAIPIGILTDYVMSSTGGWAVPYSIFGSTRLFGYVNIDVVSAFLFYIYFILAFYESFLEKEKMLKTNTAGYKKLSLIMFVLFAVFVFIYLLYPALLHINYFYFKFGIVFVLIPVVLVILKFPKLLVKFSKAGAYFFYLCGLYEFTALALNQWTFPGDNKYIALFSMFGYTFPFEEFFFWMLLGSLSVLSFYEYFDDDRK